MPSATIADGLCPAHPSSPGDTPIFNHPAVIAAMVEAYTGRARRRFPTGEMLHAAASYIPGLPASARASRTWTTCEQDGTLWVDASDVDVHQAQPLLEGPQWYVSVSPGRVRVWTRDEARDDRRQVRELELRAKAADAMATYLAEDRDVPERIPSREVVSWSRKSRSNMIGQYSDLDFTPMFADPDRLSAMLTLTYPRCWQTVAPNGKEAKKHLKKWRKRYEREFGEPIRCIWKLEFQGREQYKWIAGERVDNWCICDECAPLEDGRAPHFHMLVTLPTSRYRRDSRGRLIPVTDATGNVILGEYVREPVTVDDFRAWLSRSWADCVAHPDPVEYAAHLAAGTRVDTEEGGRAADPRRIVTYFAKHGAATAKEYQHIVPKRWREPGDGPGRFWGYWGLEKAVQTVAVTPQAGAEAGRVLRRHSRAQGVTRQTQRRRYKGGRADSKYPEVIGLAGAQLMEAHRETIRPCRTRAVRAINGRGWTVVNDGASMGAHLGRAVLAAVAHRQEQAVVELDAHTPLQRARRLSPGPRRDALIARLGGTQ